MRYLLDVNVLIALMDSAHLNHQSAHAWFGEGRDWASCPITQNAIVRILSNPAYPTVSATPGDVVRTLQALSAHPRHKFVPDDVSLGDDARFDGARISGSRAVTDTYLVGLAHRHQMRLATFDRKLSVNAVRGATAQTVVQIAVLDAG